MFKVQFIGTATSHPPVILYGENAEQVRGWCENVMGEFMPLQLTIEPLPPPPVTRRRLRLVDFL